MAAITICSCHPAGQPVILPWTRCMGLRLMITGWFSLRHMGQKLVTALPWIWVLIIYQTKDTFQNKGYSFRLMGWNVYWKQDRGLSPILTAYQFLTHYSCGQDTVNFSHLVEISVLAKQLKDTVMCIPWPRPCPKSAQLFLLAFPLLFPYLLPFPISNCWNVLSQRRSLRLTEAYFL